MFKKDVMYLSSCMYFTTRLFNQRSHEDEAPMTFIYYQKIIEYTIQSVLWNSEKLAQHLKYDIVFLQQMNHTKIIEPILNVLVL